MTITHNVKAEITAWRADGYGWEDIYVFLRDTMRWVSVRHRDAIRRHVLHGVPLRLAA